MNFEVITRTPLSDDEKMGFVNDPNVKRSYNKFLQIVYETYQNGQPVFKVSENLEKLGLDDDMDTAKRIARLLVDAGYLEELGLPIDANLFYDYLRITDQGRDSVEKIITSTQGV